MFVLLQPFYKFLKSQKASYCMWITCSESIIQAPIKFCFHIRVNSGFSQNDGNYQMVASLLEMSIISALSDGSQTHNINW